ncbi:MAG: hypothetical protein GC156_00275 [Actinomycetales bacterium]|nr:hypothetical protein [Actinomycetales bacterium]
MADQEATPDQREPRELKLRLWGLTFDAHRLVYATIILMTALAIYDEGTAPLTTQPILAMFGIAIAPLFALSMAHAFSDAIDLQIRSGHRLTWRERRHLLADNLEYLYIAIPPIMLTIVLSFFGWDANDVVGLVQLLGLASLAMWGGFAARAAGLSGWVQARFAVSYAIMGAIVITVELILTH